MSIAFLQVRIANINENHYHLRRCQTASEIGVFVLSFLNLSPLVTSTLRSIVISPRNLLLLSALVYQPLFAADAPSPDAVCQQQLSDDSSASSLLCAPAEELTIFGSVSDVRDVAGGATYLDPEDLQRFEASDVVRALRQVPGLSFQVEDGYGLRPNISIRGTATERSSRVTLMEDGILIAPAPYSAPSAYYFPTFGRINSVEVLKGPSSITQGPYTVGGAVNLISTPIPDSNSGMILGEIGSFDSRRLHGWYGGGTDQASFLIETHQWQADGYQSIDRSSADTGLDKQDYLAKLKFSNDPAADTRHSLELRFNSAHEISDQSYLGLTDSNFDQAPLRRYGLSVDDQMDNDFQQLSASWRMLFSNDAELTITAYNNDFQRAWYKTEGIDLDGSDNAQEFSRTSWANIIQAINLGNSLGGQTPEQLQAILDGADTLPGAIQLRNNSREYSSQGIQANANWVLGAGSTTHTLQTGIRYHKDEEDRLQRNDSYQQLNGELVLTDYGLEGNAGNRIQDAKAFAAYILDRIEWSALTLTPGIRFESIDLGRVDYDTGSDEPGSRDPANLKGKRSNNVDIWIPGMGLLYDFTEQTRLVAGIHKGFAVPGNSPGVDPEESINYELGVRLVEDNFELDLIGFFNDYDNLVGVCTNSSGSDCEPGDAFNGEGVHIAGIELGFSAQLAETANWRFPLTLTYTWMNAEFQSDFDSDFFGDVEAGDPVPYVPENQGLLTIGVENDALAIWLSANYVDAVCTRASCSAFEKTEAATLLDLAMHYRFSENWMAYVNAENLTDKLYIASREPYGARANKPRAYHAGVRFSF